MSLPVVSPGAMAEFDRAAAAPLERLIERAGWGVALAARRFLGGAYGKRVLVVVGPGSNGADGRVAATLLGRWGARTGLVDARDLPRRLPPSDLVIDAGFGTGFRDRFDGPDTGGAPVIAVDLPSGVDGLTGAAHGDVWPAEETVTFAAYKPGLLLSPGRELAGRIRLVDVGVSAQSPDCLVVDADVEQSWPRRATEAHKWAAATWLVGGSREAGQDMSGALSLTATGALRAGASYVRLSAPGSADSPSAPAEAVRFPLGRDWGREVLLDQRRFGCLVIGPGLALNEANRRGVAAAIEGWDGPLVLDAGALDGLDDQRELLRHRRVPAVLTPHEGEFRRLGGGDLVDRVAATRQLAQRLGAVVLLKGPTTLVCHPNGTVRYVTSGTQRLATAGSGDVLAGVIGAVLAQGLSPFEGAALAAHVHGRAATLGREVGLVAGDLADGVSRWLSATLGGRP